MVQDCMELPQFAAALNIDILHWCGVSVHGQTHKGLFVLLRVFTVVCSRVLSLLFTDAGSSWLPKRLTNCQVFGWCA